jgi:sRNA-binding protein
MSVFSTREDRELAVAALCREYPKAFFLMPQRRKPLKLGIERDIEADLEKLTDSELMDYDVADAVEWYTTHVGYKKACGVAGAGRLDLKGNVVVKITPAEAREYEKEATEIFADIENKKRRTFLTFAPPATEPKPAMPKPKALPVNNDLTSDAMLTEIGKQIDLVRSVITDQWNDPLRGELVRPALLLIADEVSTLIARLDNKAA